MMNAGFELNFKHTSLVSIYIYTFVCVTWIYTKMSRDHLHTDLHMYTLANSGYLL